MLLEKYKISVVRLLALKVDLLTKRIFTIAPIKSRLRVQLALDFLPPMYAVVCLTSGGIDTVFSSADTDLGQELRDFLLAMGDFRGAILSDTL